MLAHLFCSVYFTYLYTAVGVSVSESGQSPVRRVQRLEVHANGKVNSVRSSAASAKGATVEADGSLIQQSAVSGEKFQSTAMDVGTAASNATETSDKVAAGTAHAELSLESTNVKHEEEKAVGKDRQAPGAPQEGSSPSLPTVAGPDAKASEADMRKAVEQEAQGSVVALAAAEKMAAATEAEASELVRTATEALQRVNDTAINAMAKYTADADQVAGKMLGDVADMVSKAQSQARSSTNKLDHSSSQEQILEAINEAKSQRKQVVENAHKMQGVLGDAVETISKIGVMSTDSTNNATEEIQRLGEQAERNLTSMATELSNVGEVLGEKMQAKVHAELIAKETAEKSSEISLAAADLAAKATDIIDNLKASGARAIRQITETERDTQYKASSSLQEMVDGAERADDAHSTATTDWKTDEAKAIGNVEQAATQAGTRLTR